MRKYIKILLLVLMMTSNVVNAELITDNKATVLPIGHTIELGWEMEIWGILNQT